MIKLIVLDIDGTFYPLGDITKRNYENGAKFLAKKLSISTDEVKHRMKEYGIKPYACEDNKSITSYVLAQGVNVEEWNDYRNKNFDISKIELSACVSPEIIQKLCEKFMLVTLSSNSRINVEKVMGFLKIDCHLFKEMICADVVVGQNKQFSKENEIKKLSDKYKIAFSEMISIGDRFATDIEPMIILGGMGILIHEPRALDKVCDDLLNDFALLTNESYKVYANKN